MQMSGSVNSRAISPALPQLIHHGSQSRVGFPELLCLSAEGLDVPGVLDINQMWWPLLENWWVEPQSRSVWDVNPEGSMIGLHDGVVRQVSPIGRRDSTCHKQSINGGSVTVLMAGLWWLLIGEERKDGI